MKDTVCLWKNLTNCVSAHFLYHGQFRASAMAIMTTMLSLQPTKVRSLHFWYWTVKQWSAVEIFNSPKASATQVLGSTTKKALNLSENKFLLWNSEFENIWMQVDYCRCTFVITVLLLSLPSSGDVRQDFLFSVGKFFRKEKIQFSSRSVFPFPETAHGAQSLNLQSRWCLV